MTEKIEVNGHTVDWDEGLTIQGLLQTVDFGQRLVIVKMNGRVIPKNRYASLAVPPDAKLEIIPIVAGG